jgi:hypothetical protein
MIKSAYYELKIQEKTASHKCFNSSRKVEMLKPLTSLACLHRSFMLIGLMRTEGQSAQRLHSAAAAAGEDMLQKSHRVIPTCP